MKIANHSMKAWFNATRPWSTLVSAIAAVVTLVYLAYRNYEVDWCAAALILAAIIFFTSAGCTFSDYLDFKKGVDREDNLGGSVSLSSGEFSLREIKFYTYVLMAIAIILTVILLFMKGMPVVYFFLAVSLFIFCYPWLKYHALGDLNIFLAYTLTPVLVVAVLAVKDFHPEVFWIVAMSGLMAGGAEHINNVRDYDQDIRANIKTFAMLFGKKLSVYIYIVEILLPFFLLGAAVALGYMPLLSLIALPVAFPVIKRAIAAKRSLKEGSALLANADAEICICLFIFNILLSISFIADRWIVDGCPCNMFQ